MEKQNVPERRFSVGCAVATVWANERVVNGRSVVIKSVQLAREYQDKESGDWKRSSSYSARELRELLAAAKQAYEYLAGVKAPMEIPREEKGSVVEEELDLTSALETDGAPRVRYIFNGIRVVPA